MKETLEFILPRLTQEAKIDQIDRFVVAAIISKPNDQKVLCLKRASHDFMAGLYELPSGKVDAGEQLLEALLREVKEETGLVDVNITDYVSSFDYLSGSGKKTRQLNFVVQCSNINALRLDDKEHEGYAWLALHEVDNYNISPETKQVIRSFFLRQGLAQSPSQQLVEGWKHGIEQYVVGGVISQNEKALVLKRASDDFMGGVYELPSGKLEKGESVEMGIIREVKEETGLSVSSLGSSLKHFDYRSGSQKLTRQLNYQINVESPVPVTLSEEHEGFAWIGQNELSNYPISKEVKEILEEQLALNSLSSIHKGGNTEFFKKKRERDDDSDANQSQMKKNTLGEGA